MVGIECDFAALKVTVVGIECSDAAFLMSFKEGPHQKFFQGFFLKILQVRWQTVIIIVDIVNYLILCYYWQTLSNSFLVFISFH